MLQFIKLPPSNKIIIFKRLQVAHYPKCILSYQRITIPVQLLIHEATGSSGQTLQSDPNSYYIVKTKREFNFKLPKEKKREKNCMELHHKTSQIDPDLTQASHLTSVDAESRTTGKVILGRTWVSDTCKQNVNSSFQTVSITILSVLSKKFAVSCPSQGFGFLYPPNACWVDVSAAGAYLGWSVRDAVFQISLLC